MLFRSLDLLYVNDRGFWVNQCPMPAALYDFGVLDAGLFFQRQPDVGLDSRRDCYRPFGAFVDRGKRAGPVAAAVAPQGLVPLFEALLVCPVESGPSPELGFAHF